MLITKSETPSTRCAPISPSIRVCWVDLLVISTRRLLLLLMALIRQLFSFSKRNDPSSSPRTIVSSHHTPSRRGSRMSPRRHDSEETLVNIGDDDKLDAIPLDPFLIVKPSLNDSLLVKRGLVEETTLPQPTHSAHDIQESPSQIGRNPQGASTSGDAPIFPWKEGG
ncbi:hypothetical protein BJV77DRAFT_1008535 [Russula vinacea]|nr:hypothetical protein BJV77DRAFT_1008535 [Russula vinacea]